MSDLINALQGAGRSSSVLGAIANPTQVNPLAAYSAAAETAGKVYQVQGLQAEKAWGDALQQATDPQTGQVDYAKAQSLAAADPLAKMGMLKALPTTSGLQNDQLSRSGATLTQYSMAGATLVNDPSDANVNATFDNLKSAGFPSKTNLDAERQRVLAMSPQQRQAYGIQHTMAGLDGLQRWQQTIGTQGIINMPQGAVPYTQKPILQGGGVTTATGGVPATLSPGEAVGRGITFQADERYVKENPGTTLGQTVYLSGPELLQRQGLGRYIPSGAQPAGGGGGGVVTPDGKPVGPANPPRLLPMPGSQGATPAAPAAPIPVPPVPPAGGPPPSVAPATSPPAPAPAPAPAPVPPPAAAAPAPAPAPAPQTNPILPPNAPTAALQGGVPVASTNALVPPTGPGAGPGPAVAGDVAAMMAGMQNARTAPRGGPQTADNSVSFGPGVQEVGQWKAATDRLAADDTMAANFAQTQFPFVQALSQYGKGTVTGPGADFWNRVAGYIRTPLEKLGVPVGDFTDTNKRYDALNKWLGQIVAQTPFAAGSDARLSQVLNGSANTHIDQGAGEDMIKAGMVLQRMNVAANQQWHAMSTEQQGQYGGNYMNYLRGYSNTVDPRAFGMEMYNAEQKKNLVKALKDGTDADAKRFNDSLAIARGVTTQQALP